MTRTPPVPQGSVSPYPLGTAQAADRAGDKLEMAERARDTLDETPATAGWGRFAAGSAIGCAAVAAAVLYWNRPRSR